MNEQGSSTEHVPESIPGVAWISTADRMPTMGQLVTYILKGAPTEPKIGFRDCPRTYCDRHPGASPFDFVLTTWWTEVDDDCEAWDNDVVTYWHPLAELPS